MKKLFAMILIAILAMSTVAFAATYRHDEDDIVFEFDDTLFEISMDDHTGDEDLVILTAKDASWGDTYIRIHLRDLNDGEQFPTMDEFTAMPGASEVTQGEWNGYSNVFMYTVENVDGTSDNFFIAPVMDDDGDEVDDILTVEICVSKIEDETAQLRDDAISAVVDSLKIDD